MARGKLPSRYALTITAAIMSLIMSCIISLLLTFLHEGFGLETLKSWPLAWLQSFLVALPIAIILLPWVRRFVSRFVTD